MFDMSGDGGGTVRDARAVLADVTANYRAQLLAEDRALLLAAEWADLHGPIPIESGEVNLPGMERARQLGGDGTPEVMEFAGAQLAAAQEASAFFGSALIADALDLRHRFPLIWSRVQAGQVRASKARKVASLSRSLPPEKCTVLDEALAEPMTSLSSGQFDNLLEAKLIEVDPDGQGSRLKNRRGEQFVRVGPKAKDGMKSIYARVPAAEAMWIDGSIDRVADLLQEDGATDSHEALRARGLGILAFPTTALQLLAGAAEQTLPGLETPGPGRPGVDVSLHSAVADATCSDFDGPVVVSEADMEPWDRDDQPGRTLTGPETGRLVEAIKTIDPAKLMPAVTIHVHLAEETIKSGKGVVRMEDASPITLEILLTMLGETNCAVKIQPVIDPRDATPVTSYEVPKRMRDCLHYRHPVEASPWGTETRRSRLDMDHTVPYNKAGPPDQTNLGNVEPLGRPWHRRTTHGRWSRRQPSPGTLIWRDPLGYFYLTNYAGTHTLGKDTFAQKIWAAAAPESAIN